MTTNAPPWLVAWLEGISAWDALLFFAGLVALWLFIRHKGWVAVVALARAVVNSAQILEAVQGLPAYIDRADERHDRLEEKVDGIYHETHNNDGSSVKDAVDRIEKSIDEDVKPTLVRLAASDDDLWAAFDDTQKPEGDTDD